MSVAIAQDHTAETTELETPPDQSYLIDIDDDIHEAIDRVIYYYDSQDVEPRFTFTGSPLDIAAGLAREVKASLPQDFAEDARVLLDYMIAQFVDYCREVKSNNLSVTFAFKRGKNNHKTETPPLQGE